MNGAPYWNFKSLANGNAELYLYKEISSWGEGEYSDSAKSFKRELDALGEVRTLDIYINSPGGDIFEGHAIYNMLQRAPFRKVTHADGVAASIASELFEAGDWRVMPENAMLMIHNGWRCAAGDANSLRKAADDVEKITESMKAVYLSRTDGKITEQRLGEMMDAETWLSARDCLQYGFCDEVIPAKQLSACMTAGYTGRYRNMPPVLAAKTPEAPQAPAKDPEAEALIHSARTLIKIMEVTQ